MNKIKYKKIYIFIVLALILLPFVFAIHKSIPAADDFTVAQNSTNVIKELYYGYVNWGGCWIGNLYQLVVTKIAVKNLNIYSIFLEGTFALYVISFLLLIKELNKLLFSSEKERLGFDCIVLLFLLLNYKGFQEIFYWLNASTYGNAMAFNFLTIAFAIKTLRKNSVFDCTMTVIFGFIACCSFTSATFPGLIVFLLIIYDYYKNKKINIKLVIILIFMLVSGSIAAFAPGNFARKSSMSGGSNIGIICLIYGAFDSIISLISIFKNPITIFIAIFSYYIGYKNEKNVVIYKPINVVLISLAIIIINSYLLCLPIAIGYSGIGGFQNRTEFMTEIPIVVEIMAAGLCIGNCFKVHGLLKFDKKDKRILLIVLALFFYATEISSDKYKSLPSFEICENIVRIDQTNKFWINTFNDLKNHKNEDVIVYVNDYVENCPVLNTPCITEDKDNWVNVAVADYFGLKSITVVVKE